MDERTGGKVAKDRRQEQEADGSKSISLSLALESRIRNCSDCLLPSAVCLLSFGLRSHLARP